MKDLYLNYLKGNGCKSLTPVPNRFSRLDAVMISGESFVVIEYKKRKQPIHKFNTAMLEKKKYEKLLEGANLFDCIALFICEYEEAILIWNIQKDDELVWQSMDAPFSQTDDSMVDKEITMLDYYKADYIIAKSNWVRKTQDELKSYINRKANE